MILITPLLLVSAHALTMSTVYVALLRGINVNGHRVIKMAELRSSLEQEASFSSVKTWLQSGNVLVQTRLKDPNEVSSRIIAIIEKDFGLDDVPVMIRTTKQIQDTISHNPFSSKPYDAKRIFVAFLNELPCPELLKAMDQIDYGKEKYVMKKDLNAIYFYVPDFAKYKLDTTLFEKKLKIKATSRNWRTTNKLVELSEEMSKPTVTKGRKKKEASYKTKSTEKKEQRKVKKKEETPPPRVGERRSKRKRS
jgi:uncharacterized protein (DUF1697 family)